MKEVLQIAYLRHLQDFYLFESVKDGIIAGIRSTFHFLFGFLIISRIRFKKRSSKQSPFWSHFLSRIRIVLDFWGI